VIPCPAADEYDPYFAGYIALAEGDVFAQLERQLKSIQHPGPGENL
jgi:hypothetical protein